MADEEYGQGVPKVISPQMGSIDSTVESIRYRAQLIARNQKLDSGVAATGISGLIAGFVFAFIMVIVLPMAIWGMM